MPGIYQYDVEIKSNVAKLLSDMKQVQDRLDTVEGKEYKIKLNVDEKKLSSVISNLEKMLDSLGKGTGDFKQFENLSKELSSVVSEVQSLSKAFGKVDDSGTKTLLSSIQNIDKSLSELSQNILNVNKNMGNMGGNTSGAVKQIENIGNAAADAVKQVDKLADAQSKTNVANGLDSSISKYQEIVSLVKEYYELTSKIKQPTLKRQSRSEDYDRIDGYLLKKAPQKVGTTDIEKDINDRYHKMAKGVNEGSEFAIKAMKSAIQRYWSDVTEMPSDEKLLSSRKVVPYGNKGQKEEYIIPKKYQDLEKSVIQETIAMNQNNAAYEEEQKQIKANNAAIEERLNLIRQSIKQNDKNSDYNGEYKMGLSLKASDRNKKDIFGMTSNLSQEEMLKEICNMLGVEIPQNAEKAKQAIKEVSSTPQESNISGRKDAFPDKDVSASVESATNSIKEENNVLEQNTQKVKENTQAKEQNANVNFNKYDKRLDSYNDKIDKYKTTIDRFNDGGWTSNAYLENVQAVMNAVKKYEDLLNELKGKDASLVTSEDINKLDSYEKKIKDTITTVTNMSASEKGYSRLAGQKEIDKINKILRENSAMSSEAKAKIKAYKQELISGNPSVSLEKIHGEILKIVNAEELAGRAGRSFFDTLKNSGFHQLAAQMAGMFGFYDVINLGKKGFNVVRELNTALTEMRKVSNETVQSLKNYQATTFDTADAVGTTAKQIQNSTADWMRLGESMDQAAESAKDANVLFNVSEFEGIDEATESLVSMSQAYKDLDKMDIIDVLNNIGNNYSISTDGLATALKDSASALVTANNDLNEAVSLTTAGNAITQDPSKVGAGLRTISLRLVGTEEAKEELSDLGEETDGMITTVSKLRDTIMDATKAASSDGKGFDILDSNGNYKSTYEIMQGLADLYDDIVKKDKELGTNNLNLLLETIAGKNRSNIAASILQNGDMLRSVYEDAQNSEGSAEKELNSYLDSIDGKIAQLENRAQEFWFKVIDSETIKNGIDLLSTLLKGATDFVDTVGLLPTILTGIGAALSFKNVG